MKAPIQEYRERSAIWNSFGKGPKWSMEDLPLTDEQKVLVLEWYARKIMDAFVNLGIQDGYGKSYDPMSIEEDRNVAHSYVFDLEDGGRHHAYVNLADLERRLSLELTTQIRDYVDDGNGFLTVNKFAGHAEPRSAAERTTPKEER